MKQPLDHSLREISGALEVFSRSHEGVDVGHVPDLYRELAEIHVRQCVEARQSADEIKAVLRESEHGALYTNICGTIEKVRRYLSPLADGKWGSPESVPQTAEQRASAAMIPYVSAAQDCAIPLMKLADQVMGTLEAAEAAKSTGTNDEPNVTELKRQQTRELVAKLQAEHPDWSKERKVQEAMRVLDVSRATVFNHLVERPIYREPTSISDAIEDGFSVKKSKRKKRPN